MYWYNGKFNRGRTARSRESVRTTEDPLIEVLLFLTLYSTPEPRQGGLNHAQAGDYHWSQEVQCSQKAQGGHAYGHDHH